MLYVLLYVLCSLREKHSVERVSTAYEFYQAVKRHLIFSPSTEKLHEKPIFKATNYELFYAASDEEDARGKECHMVVRRENMWDCTTIHGCLKCHHFAGLPIIDNIMLDHNSSMYMRELPCPCGPCLANRFDECQNVIFAGILKVVPIRRKIVKCPVLLTEPIGRYNTCILKKFMTENNLIFPKNSKKEDYVNVIRNFVNNNYVT